MRRSKPAEMVMTPALLASLSRCKRTDDVRELAEIRGVHVRTVYEWMRQSDFPVDENGAVPLLAFYFWCEANGKI